MTDWEPPHTLTEDEIAAYRRQKIEGNRIAKEAAAKRGYTLHPRIAAARNRRPPE